MARSEYAPQIRQNVAARQSAPCFIFEMSRVQNWGQGPAVMPEVLVGFRHALRNEGLDDISHRVSPCPIAPCQSLSIPISPCPMTLCQSLSHHTVSVPVPSHRVSPCQSLSVSVPPHCVSPCPTTPCQSAGGLLGAHGDFCDEVCLL